MTTSTSSDARLVDEGYVETIVIGAGQAGLSMGYHLQRLGRPFVILDDRVRVGDAWRQRWDSLRLFTPAKYDALDGMPFPAEPSHFPTKDEMADYLEAYAERFALPIRHGVRVERVSRTGDRFLVESGAGRWTADNVVVAMAGFQQPHIPGFADDLDPSVVQLHSSAYREPGQLGEGDVLVVGAGNSGSDIAMDIVRHDQQVGSAGRRVLLAGRDTGQIPFHIESRFGRAVGMRFVLRFLFRRVLNVRTPIGRRARPKILSSGGPLIRLKAREITSAGIERVSRVEGVRDGMPVLADGERGGGVQRGLGDRVRPRLPLDRPAGARRAGAPAPQRRVGGPPRAVLPGPAVPRLDGLGDDPRRRPGRCASCRTSGLAHGRAGHGSPRRLRRVEDDRLTVTA